MYQLILFVFIIDYLLLILLLLLLLLLQVILHDVVEKCLSINNKM